MWRGSLKYVTFHVDAQGSTMCVVLPPWRTLLVPGLAVPLRSVDVFSHLKTFLIVSLPKFRQSCLGTCRPFAVACKFQSKYKFLSTCVLDAARDSLTLQVSLGGAVMTPGPSALSPEKISVSVFLPRNSLGKILLNNFFFF